MTQSEGPLWDRDEDRFVVTRTPIYTALPAVRTKWLRRLRTPNWATQLPASPKIST